MNIYMLIAAVLPAIVLIWHIYRRDAYHPEPIGKLAKGFGWGIMAVFLSLVVDTSEYYKTR